MARAPFRITDMRVIGALAPQTGDVTAPTIPQNVLATAINAGRVDLSWTASTDDFGVSGYQIFRNGSPLTTTSSTTLSDTTCQPSTFYSYVVVAFDGAGNSSAPSNPGTATTPANAAPVWQSIPTQTLTVGNSYLLQLTDYCTDADLDTITFSIPSGTLPTGVVLSGNRLQGTPTTAGETPTVTVRAADAFHQINTTIAFSTKNADVTAPPIPTGLAANPVSSSQVNVSWNSSTDAAGGANELVSGTKDYRLYRDGALRVTQTGTTYNDTGLAASTAYSYRVTARDNALNESSQSSAVVATTQSGTAITPQQDWINRSTAAGVTAAYEMTPAQITAGYTNGDAGAQGFADSTVNAGWGTALRLHSPATSGNAGQLPAGQWHGFLNGSYGQNSRMCLSWLMRLTASMFSNLANNGGSWNSNWKTITVYPGGPPCQAFEFTMVHPDPFTPGGGPASAYKNCGDNFSTVLTSSTGTSNTNPAGAYWQQDFIPSGSTREALGYRAAVGSGSGMFQYPADRWVEVYVEIVWTTFSSSNNTVSCWVDDLQGPVRGRRRIHGWNGQYPGTNGSSDRMSEVLLMNYMTSNSGKTNIAADAWYKAFIASSQPIAPWTAVIP